LEPETFLFTFTALNHFLRYVLQEKLYQVALGMIPGVGSMYTKTLISHIGSAEKIFSMPKGKLLQIPGVGQVLAQSICNSKESLVKAEKQLERAEKEKARLIFYTDKEYPVRFKEVPDAPVMLYVKGPADLNSKRTVAIVGTRSATEYGKSQTEKLVEELGPWSPLIISGLAYGIDVYAHQACLNKQIPTLGVMASGLDYIYPTVHKNIASRMTEMGGLATEYGYGTMPEVGFFPARNRIVAALSDVVIVIEAAAKGGALITAELANGYHREVFALPGNLTQSHSKGCLNLIRDHKAHILTETMDLVKLMNWDQQTSEKKEEPLPDNLSETEISILRLLQEQGDMALDDLSWKSSISLNKLAGLLLKLEMDGLIKALPGKRFKKK
jgi:DNA processing protein